MQNNIAKADGTALVCLAPLPQCCPVTSFNLARLNQPSPTNHHLSTPRPSKVQVSRAARRLSGVIRCSAAAAAGGDAGGSGGNSTAVRHRRFFSEMLGCFPFLL